MARADFSQVATVYDAGRSLPEETMEAWRAVIAPHLPERTPLVGLDVGCGTGRFTSKLAEWFKAEIVGVDPAVEMLRVANSHGYHQGVTYVLGQAESLPLSASSFDFAWLSTVIHHVDLAVVARELRRVLKPESRVLIRSWFPGRGDVTHFHYFPRAREIAETFPTVEAVVEVFGVEGFEQTSLDSVAQVSAPSLRAFRERVKTRADTTLLALTDAEFDEGMRALDAEAAAETDPRPVISYLDLMVLK
jgi:ubiquinone/menaquinone biosynthesis C-methylase UbiE